MRPLNEPGVGSVLAKMGSEHDGRAMRRNRALPFTASVDSARADVGERYAGPASMAISSGLD